MKHFRRFDDLTWKYMKAYKKRTIFTILGVMLAVFLFFGGMQKIRRIFRAMGMLTVMVRI